MLLACTTSRIQGFLIKNSSFFSCHVPVVCMCVCGGGMWETCKHACLCVHVLGGPEVEINNLLQLFFHLILLRQSSQSKPELTDVVSTATLHWDPSPPSGSKSWTSRWGPTGTHVGCGTLNARHRLLGQCFDLCDTALAPKLL